MTTARKGCRPPGDCAIAADEMVPHGQPPPKQGDFKHWLEVIANAIAPGSSAKADPRPLEVARGLDGGAYVLASARRECHAPRR
jgi:hypothetical protein